MKSLSVARCLFLAFAVAALPAGAQSHEFHGGHDIAPSADGSRYMAVAAAAPSRDGLTAFRVPGNAPYFANELIEAAKLGNTPAGFAAMSAAAAKVRDAARRAIVGDGFGGVTKKTASAEIENYLFAIARSNPAAGVAMSRAIAPGTGLRKALNPSRNVAAALSRMASAARMNLPRAPSPQVPARQRSLALGEDTPRPQRQDVARAASNVPAPYRLWNSDAEVAALNQRSPAFGEQVRPPGQAAVAASAMSSVPTDRAGGGTAEVARLDWRWLASGERRPRRDPASAATSLNFLTSLSFGRSGDGKAEEGARRLLAFVNQHPSAATDLNFLASLSYVQGRDGYAEAAPAHRRSPAIAEKAQPPVHRSEPPSVATSLSFLALGS